MYHKIGIHIPADRGKLVTTGVDFETDNEYEIYKSTSGFGWIVGLCHPDVGLVTWYFADSDYSVSELTNY